MARTDCRTVFKLFVPALLVLGGVFAAAGCAQRGGTATRVVVETDPSSAALVAVTPGGQTVNPRGVPPEFRLRFPEDDPEAAYTIIATPLGNDGEEFLPTEFTITEASISAGRDLTPIADREGVYRLDLELDRRTFEELAFLEIVLDPRGGWTSTVTRRRAFDDVTERGGSAPQRIARFNGFAGIRGISLSPGGDRMVYSIAEGEAVDVAQSEGYEIEAAGVTRSNLRGIRLAGGGIEQITVDDFLDFDPAFSADGQHLLFASNRRKSAGSDILRIRSTARAGGIQNVYTDPKGNWLVSPSEGANGTIVFNMIPADPTGTRELDRPGEIWTIGGQSRFPTQVTLGLQPAISPDGSRIAFIREGNLWVCNSDGSGETQLTTDADQIVADFGASLRTQAERTAFETQEVGRTFFPYGHPTWSPDGRFIVYTSMQGQDPTGRRQEDIWVMDADGGLREQLTTNPSTDRFPLVSPDGASVYFVSNRGREWAIWRVPAPEFMQNGMAGGR